MEDYTNRFRLDVQGIEVRVDDATGAVYLRPIFDPERYTLEAVDGETILVDHQDNQRIPFRLIQELIEKSLSHPLVGDQQQLGDAVEYVESRKTVVKERLAAQNESRPIADPSAEWLSRIPDGIHPFAILSVDIVGSTKLSEAVEPVAYARMMAIVQDELAVTCPYFHAHVLKFTGDGVLAYFPANAFLTANDNAIDCALTMRLLVHNAVNPALADLGHPQLNVRIGIESGGAVAITLGDPSTKSQRDLIGRILSMACKIQSSGLPGEIRIGQVAYQNMHTMWKKGCVPASLPSSWDYKLKDGSLYPIHVFRAMGTAI